MYKFKYMIFLLKILVSTTLLIFVANNVDFSRIFELLKSFETSSILITIVVLVIQILIANIRWMILLNVLNFRLTYIELLQYFWIGIFFNQMLPSSIGGDAARIYYLRKSSGNIKSATLGVFLDRIFGIAGLSFLAWSVLFFLPSALDDSIIQSGIIISFGVFGLVSVLFVLDYLPFNLPNWKIIRGLNSLSLNARNAILSRNFGLVLIILSISIHLLSVIVFIALSEGMALDINWLDMLSIIPLIILFTLIPISFAGWGLREGVMIVGMGYLNVQLEQALALSILYGLLVLITSIPGGLFWLFNYKMNIKSA